MRQTLILCARVESGHASRQKTGEMCDFCLPVGSNSGCAASKVEQNIQNFEKCSTAASKFGARGSESRQKPVRMSHFCLPDSPKSGRVVSKVEQNLKKLKKCSTTASKFGPRGSESRTKSSKIEKMFYRRLQIRSARLRK